MKTRKQKETGEKEVHLLEQKGYEKMVNEIVPVQQAEVYRKPTHKAVKEAVKELNPDTNREVCRNARCTSFFVHHYTNLFTFFKLRSFEDFFDLCVPSI
ncbi:MAG: hypothetical protein ACLSFV_01085 [Bacteroides xylanisolvens]